MVKKVARNVLEGIDLIVYDMAGTVVEEGGVVYKTLRTAMNADGLSVSEDEMHPWHGAKKEAVIEHFAKKAGTPDHEVEDRILRIGEAFLSAIDSAYFSDASPIDHIDGGLVGYLKQLRKAGIKVGFDTGYPPEIQKGLIDKLGFEKSGVVDAYVSSYQVTQGRPYPYMIYNLMEKTGVMNVKRVAKVGDSVRDIEEGRNAGCGLVVGVLSGADGFDELMAAGADLVCDYVTDLPVPQQRRAHSWTGLPDFS